MNTDNQFIVDETDMKAHFRVPKCIYMPFSFCLVLLGPSQPYGSSMNSLWLSVLLYAYR
jgi:hypothetical protein